MLTCFTYPGHTRLRDTIVPHLRTLFQLLHGDLCPARQDRPVHSTVRALAQEVPWGKVAGGLPDLVIGEAPPGGRQGLVDA